MFYFVSVESIFGVLGYKFSRGFAIDLSHLFCTFPEIAEQLLSIHANKNNLT